MARGKHTDRIGRGTIEDFSGAFMKDEVLGRPKLLEAADPHVLSDHTAPVISILNLASVNDIEWVTKKPIDPHRFRANVWLAGAKPWREFDWVNKQITIGDLHLTVPKSIDRCAAINVNPKTAERDQNIVKALQMGFRHIDVGVYANVETKGVMRTGDTLITQN